MATLSNLETDIVSRPDHIRFQVAGVLYQVRQKLANGFSFATATAQVMSIPENRRTLQQASDLGWTGANTATDLTTLTGP